MVNNMNDFNISKNFKLREFAGRDGSNLVKDEKKVINKVQSLKDRNKRHIIITSDYRTESHNRKVGGTKNSQHLYGKAVDIKVSGMTPQTLLKHAEAVGFTGIGLYKWGIHVDVRKNKARW